MQLAAILAALLGLAKPQSAQQIYTAALTAMSDLSQPRYITYKLEGQSDGLQVDLVVQRGNVWLNIHGGATAARWALEHRTYDYESVIVNDADGQRYLSARSFFDPTWYGTLRALREGMFNTQDPAAPRGQATPTPPPSVQLKTIAVVSVMGSGIYRIEDRGDAVCSNGDPGHALHLISRTNNRQHQLTDVIVDMRSMRFCMLRFALNGAALGFQGIMEEHYGDVGGYWMQTDGFLEGTVRLMFIATNHGMWRYRLIDVTFPELLPAQEFTAEEVPVSTTPR